MISTITPYTYDHTSDLLDLFKASVHQIASKDYTAEQCNAWAPEIIDLQEWHKSRAAQPTYVAIQENKPVGFTDLNASGYIHMFYVHPDYTRQGVASKLYRHILNIARTKNIPTLSANISITAMPVFKKWGFEIAREQTVMRNGQSFTNYHMTQDIT